MALTSALSAIWATNAIAVRMGDSIGGNVFNVNIGCFARFAYKIQTHNKTPFFILIIIWRYLHGPTHLPQKPLDDFDMLRILILFNIPVLKIKLKYIYTLLDKN